MARLIIFLTLFLSLILQLALMPRLSVFGVFPNIVLAAILVISVKSDSNYILASAFLLGLALDFFSSLPFGVWTVSFAITLWLLETAGKKFFRNTDFSGRAFLIVAACLFFGIFQPLLFKAFNWFGSGVNFSFWQNILRFSLPEFVLNSILALLFLMFFNRSHGLRGRI